MNDSVFHKVYGQCSVIVDRGDTLIIRSSDNDIHEVLKSDIEAAKPEEYSYRRTMLRLQSALISSINNTWGVFNRSKINLLPHQLWVCNRVMRQWPTRMLVADDVGLGKTVEAGLILLSAIYSGKARRIIIMTPASLTENWKKQLFDKFGLGFTIFTNESGKKNKDFFENHDHVIVSIPTLVDNQDRIDAFLEASPWDMVFVDEAHHIGTRGKHHTRGFRLFEEMEEKGKVNSAVFFTATPHQGINDDFWHLMELLNKDAFEKSVPVSERYEALNEYMIRNNKTDVIDMNGTKLFKGIHQHQEMFSYTPEEAEFYTLMSEFIDEGYAYASSTDDEDMQNRQKLVLSSLQKIATSSVAAIQGAIQSRIMRLKNNIKDSEKADEDDDEKLAEDAVFLMEDEIYYLQQLLDSAAKVKKESRIDKVLEIIDERYQDESILFFTEYKKTQRLLIEALINKYGEDSVTFINGDNALKIFGRDMTIDRESVTSDFNNGKIRFLVSTEASSEGIDLQNNCHVLIHVDLPWNPMRMQQRVGRIYRYGQTQDVEVVSIRNPETIEFKIWKTLEVKLRNIMKAFGKIMDNPDDLLMLVIGMQDQAFYDSIYAEGANHGNDFDTWFDQKTKTFGSQDAIDFIQSMVSNAASFDLSDLMQIPSLGLESLKPFMEGIVRENGVTPDFDDDDGTLSFKLPKEWKTLQRAMGKSFTGPSDARNLAFTRDAENVKKICGVGNIYLNVGLYQAYRFQNSMAIIPGKSSYLIVRVYERITDINGSASCTYIGYRFNNDGTVEKLNDQELFVLTLDWLKHRTKEKNVEAPDDVLLNEYLERAKIDYEGKGIHFTKPDSELFAYLVGEDC